MTSEIPAPLRRSAAGMPIDDVRRRNLGLILSMVHETGGVSRSQLTASTGLNRSTIAGLVAELVGLGLVREALPEESKVGRPSPVVQPDRDVVAIAINPEVDGISLGLVSLEGEVLRRVRYPAESAPTVSETVRVCAAIIDGMRDEFASRYRAVGIGVAVPGLVREVDGVVRFAPHLEWSEEPIAERLAEATGFATVAANDARLGALAERVFGAAREHDDFIYLNGGASGIGGSAFVNGAPLKGASGYAGEWGHVVVSGENTWSDDEGASLERLVNRAALLRAASAGAAGPIDAAMLGTALTAVGTGTAPVALVEEVRLQQGYLGTAIRNAVNVLNPEAVLLGGFLGELFDADPDGLRQVVARQALAASADGLEIRRAELGEDLLMIGAAELAFAPLLADPAGVARRLGWGAAIVDADTQRAPRLGVAGRG